MRRNNAVTVEVVGPSRGLQTRVPSNLASPDKRAIVVGQNVRAERGVLRNAPGYERIISSPRNLDSPANLIFQANVLDPDREVQTTPFVGTGSSLYVMRRRSKALVCEVNGDGISGTCNLKTAVLGDSGRVGSDLAAVATLIKSWSPDTVVHLGDIVYADGVIDPHVSDYEECVGQYFGMDYVGGYNGAYGVGPVENKFFPTLGNHDWDDGGIFNYLDFFQLAKNPNERYYHYKRASNHFIHLNSGGFSGGSVDPDGFGAGSAQATWLEGILAASDCPWLWVFVHFPGWCSDINYYPGNAAVQTLAPLFAKYGVTAVISGHAHNSELLQIDGVAYSGGTGSVVQLISGSGGHSLRTFHDPASPYSQWKDNSAYGAGRLTTSRTAATFEWIDVSGNILHTKTFDIPRANSGICYIGDVAKEIFTLEVRPDEASVEVGSSWSYRAFANYQDGTIEDVTERCTWVSDDDTIGAVGSTTGVATGNSPGDATITATFRGVSDDAIFHVLHSCVDDPTEVIFCLSRAGSLGAFSGGMTRLDAVKEAVEQSIDSLDPEIDMVGLVSFAGDFETQAEDATLDSYLTDDFASVKDALNLLVPDGANGVPSGLDTAYTELTGIRHTDGHLRAVILVVDWPADVTNPGGVSTGEAAAITAAMAAASVSATAIKALDHTTLIVVGYNIPAAYRTSLSALATVGYYFDVNTPEELKTTLADLPHTLCFYDGYYYYYYVPPACGSPWPDYTNLFDWDVIHGCIDLAGVGPGGETSDTAWNPRPGNGMYLDMVGTNPDNSPGHDSTCGKIRTKHSFTFTAGKSYKLSFYDCNYYPPDRSIEVSITNDAGGNFVDPVTFTPPNADFQLEEIDFIPTTSGTGKIIVETPELAPSFPRTGVLLDRVKLENITDSVEMLYNDFDGENPCSL